MEYRRRGNGAATCNYTMNPYPPDPNVRLPSPAGVPDFTYPGTTLFPMVHMTVGRMTLDVQDQGKGVAAARTLRTLRSARCNAGLPSYIHPYRYSDSRKTWMIMKGTLAVIYTDGGTSQGGRFAVWRELVGYSVGIGTE